ncbi:DEAD/DEAH box helicase [Microbacterium indicum]|uniref:DEAD/DEAH box helicase n=1 Tax=Microbacterium indicum TaxID=358100 RepID=UPI000423C289|nr:DEAD/DEAH box helicase [Microbacterium indicum]
MLEPWERALRGVLDRDAPASDADPPGDIALLFSVRGSEAGDPPGDGVAIRPLVRGARGAWVRSALTWRDIVDSGSEDPRWRALEDVLALHLSRENFAASTERLRPRGGYRTQYGGGWGAPDWVRLDAVPSRGLWGALRDAHDAGVIFLGDGDAPVAVSEIAGTASIDLRMARGRLRVEPVIAIPESPAEGRRYPLGAPTVAVAQTGGERGGIDLLVPLAEPVSAEFDALHRADHLSIPAARVADFVHDYLPGLREIAPLASRDGSFEIPPAPRPRLVLAVRHAAPVAHLYWEWEYPPGARPHRRAEREIMAAVDEAAGRFAHLLGRGPRDLIHPARDLGPDETVEFLAEVLPALRGIGDLSVELHDEVPAYAFATEDPVVRVGVDPGGRDWFELRIVVTIQGEPVPNADLLTALAQGRTYFTLMSGTVFPLVAPAFARLRDILAQARALDDPTSETVRIGRYDLDLWQELAEIGVIARQESAWFEALAALGDDRIERADPPASFRAELRGYQRDGFSWLDFLRRHRLGGVLADDMGLGKTVQMLAALDQARVDEPGERFLVVTPTSVVGHWAAEAERFAPGLGARAIAETTAKRGAPLAEAAGDATLLITSYAIFRIDAEEFRRLGFRILVLDEAQQVKNTQSRGYAAARLLEAPSTFVVTGTPMENDLMELFALVTLAAPGLLGTRSRFREGYQRAIEREGDGRRLAELRRRIRPFLLRRTKERVAPELPEKSEQVLEIPLDPAHQRAYEKRFRREQQKLLGLLDDVDRNRIQILASLTTLRRHALDPSFAGVDAPSAKLDALARLLGEVVADGHRVLVFSQFAEFLGMAAGVADEMGIRYAHLDGSTTQRRRAAMIDRFRSGEIPAFFISLKAGGVGLTLTEADYVVLLDPWWNPAAEEQAVDRTHRIGQERPVMVYRLIAAGTIEQKVRELQQRKRRLFDGVLGGSDDLAPSALTTADFRALLT